MKIVIVALVVAILAAGVATAFTVNTSSYLVASTHLGLTGGLGNSSSYSFRSLGTFEQAGNMLVRTPTYLLNLGYYETQLAAELTFAVNVSLVSPADGAFLNESTVNFTSLAVTAGSLDECSLYTNESGWMVVQTSGSVVSGVNYSWAPDLFADGEYSWNVLCNTTSGNESFAPANASFTVDTTPPTGSFDEPGLVAVSSPVSFVINHSEANPDAVTLRVDGANYTQSYSGAITSFSVPLAEGVYSYNATLNDSAGNELFLGPFTLNVSYVNITITNLRFSPSPPFAGVDNELTSLVSGSPVAVWARVQRNNLSPVNYTASGPSTDPAQYSVTAPGGSWGIGDNITVRWYAQDAFGNLYNSTAVTRVVVRNQPLGGSVSTPAKDPAPAAPGLLNTSVDEVVLATKNQVRVPVTVVGGDECVISRIHVRDVVGTRYLDERVRINAYRVDAQGMTVPRNETFYVTVQPRTWQTVSGGGELVVESDNCPDLKIPFRAQVGWGTIARESLLEVSTWLTRVVQGVTS